MLEVIRDYRRISNITEIARASSIPEEIPLVGESCAEIFHFLYLRFSRSWFFLNSNYLPFTQNMARQIEGMNLDFRRFTANNVIAWTISNTFCSENVLCFLRDVDRTKITKYYKLNRINERILFFENNI